tara:strand:- start:757 stop:1002 length:246 start_codon:yes stop_codon:yes gene_type:complete
MQKIINVIAIASGIVSLSVVGGGVYLYTQKDAIIESVTEKALGSIGGGAIGGALGGLGQAAPSPDEPALPQLPSTGPVNPF